MDYGIEVLQEDIRQVLQLTNIGAYGSMPKTGRAGIKYYELGTDDKGVWDDWLAALNAANRPYKYIPALNAAAVPVNVPQW